MISYTALLGLPVNIPEGVQAGTNSRVSAAAEKVHTVRNQLYC